MREFPFDIIVGDHLMLGVLPLLLGPRSKRAAGGRCWERPIFFVAPR